ncbi:NAD-dependent protein deacylase [Vagococcus penaei]|uniref:NAD-dependent protein deacylase n=1 Tax=Vagococcus penaei TaxID=633807 RepID=A0A1Q2D6Q7_9ENTE|nr:NAD-dependent protein deacylase [Vagococcus penaei]AQP53955.1 NAD-dependent protein deacylase [Vagococcus penaei]RSU02879.1 NAD-dependent protein deacylase [Vagococcus penaei]
MEKTAVELIQQSKKLVFMTGAGVSVPSGIPDYRSMTGVYHGVENPEYLLSHSCLVKEPEKFYDFVKQLYHPKAKPNIIHLKMAELAQEKDVTVISQNIDGLHQQAGSPKVINFHGNLYDCYCQKCGESVTAEEFMESSLHKNCGGQIRPNVVLYEESLPQDVIEASILAIEQADTIVVVGTSLKVYPFSGLIQYRQPNSQLIIINKDTITYGGDYLMVQTPAENFFSQI